MISYVIMVVKYSQIIAIMVYIYCRNGTHESVNYTRISQSTYKDIVWSGMLNPCCSFQLDEEGRYVCRSEIKQALQNRFSQIVSKYFNTFRVKMFYAFRDPNHCDYTDVGNGALRTSSMADTLTGSCLFVPISPIKRRN